MTHPSRIIPAFRKRQEAMAALAKAKAPKPKKPRAPRKAPAKKP
ncbi:MAG: hypothetical protein ACREEW_13750 [Caulobacteraceae bacterium]